VGGNLLGSEFNAKEYASKHSDTNTKAVSTMYNCS
jgi:hypothetical protein